METILEKVRDFADKAHGEQTRKYSPERYIVHPVRVMETCRNYDARLPVLAAALLHDVLEDTTVGREEMLDFLYTVMEPIEARFTLALVVELTDVYVKSAYPDWNRRLRKQHEIDRIGQTSPDSQTIKYADILDNTNEIVTSDPDFAPRYLRECLAILQRADRGNSDLRSVVLDSVRQKIKQL